MRSCTQVLHLDVIFFPRILTSLPCQILRAKSLCGNRRDWIECNRMVGCDKKRNFQRAMEFNGNAYKT